MPIPQGQMAAYAPLLSELEDTIRRGSPARHAETLERLTTLFVNGAARFNEDHVQVFDEVFSRLVVEIEGRVRAELSNRFAGVANAPVRLIRKLAEDADITVAGPVLRQSPRLSEDDLVAIASTYGQPHLLAISARPNIAEPVTDVLVRRGEREVIHRLTDNRRARLSEAVLSKLVDAAQADETLAEKIALRPDLPLRMYQELVKRASEAVQQRLLALAPPEIKPTISDVLAEVSRGMASAAARDYTAAQRAVASLRRSGKLDQAKLVELAKGGQYEVTVAALALLCSVPIDVVDRLMGSDRPDPILILGRAAGWEWRTVRAIIAMRPGGKETSAQVLDAAYSNFERLSLATAQRVIRFWQARQPDGLAGL